VLETGAASLGITVADFEADLISVNIDISGLESDVKSLNGTINKSKIKKETYANNIGTINSISIGINNSISSLGGRVAE
jgi:hypothetical protein